MMSQDVVRMPCSSFQECCVFLVFSLLICKKKSFLTTSLFCCCGLIAMLSLANTDVIIVRFA